MDEKYIVLLDDDERLVELLTDALEDHFPISSFTDPFEAKDYIKKNHEKIDIVISDYNMPKQNGVDFIRGVKEINSTISCLLFTGYAEDVELEEAKQFCCIVQKSEMKAISEFIELLKNY